MKDAILTRFQQNMLPEADGVLVTSRFNRRYLTGFDASDGLLVITRESADAYFDGRYLEDAKNKVEGFALHLLEHTIWQQAARAVKDRQIVRLGLEDKQLTFFQWQQLTQAMPGTEPVPYSDSFDKMRRIKTTNEIASISAAQSLAEEVFLDILPLIRPGRTELEIAVKMEGAMREKGAEGAAFDSIVLSGKNTSMPHGKPSKREISNGDFVLLDFGCIVDGYCSDMTRTVAVGPPGSEMKRVYETVLAAQKAAIEGIRGGITGKEADAFARGVIERAGFGSCFGHSLGHGIGLEVHETPVFAVRYTQPIESGVVMSVEPGIYIPSSFGVRIEDMVLLTDDGCLNLTRCPKELLVL